MKVFNEYIEITDLKDMLKKTGKIYGDKPAYKIRENIGKYKIITHKEARQMVDSLGTALIDLGLKGKRIAIIGKNRYEWEIAYLSIACGTGIVVPLDKSLPENELKRLIERSDIEAIFYSEKYEEMLNKMIYSGTGKLKHLISMDLKEHKKGRYSQKELIETGKELINKGNREFLDAKIDPEAMNIMLFTSGTTSESKVVSLCHRNLCSNLMDIASVLDINSNDRILSFLPLHHVFECTVGFLFSLYRVCQTSFCDGIRHIVENLNEYEITFAAFVPAIYENMYRNIIRKFYTGDLAKIDKDGYIFICGRKKSVIVLKNGKNIFPEEMENLVNRIEGVKESFIFGKSNKADKDDIRIHVKVVYDEDVVKEAYKVNTEAEIYEAINNKIKEINRTMPPYKAIRGMILTQTPLIKTTTSKIKRQEEIKTVA